jgi:hypothetical protein
MHVRMHVHLHLRHTEEGSPPSRRADMIRAQAVEGDVVHLWASDFSAASEQALCGAAGPASYDQAGRVCPRCWQAHGGSLDSAFARAAAARTLDQSTTVTT